MHHLIKRLSLILKKDHSCINTIRDDHYCMEHMLYRVVVKNYFHVCSQWSPKRNVNGVITETKIEIYLTISMSP